MQESCIWQEEEIKMVKRKGWRSQSKRHSNARKYGRAGGRYASGKPKKRFKTPMPIRNKKVMTKKNSESKFAIEVSDLSSFPPETSQWDVNAKNKQDAELKFNKQFKKEFPKAKRGQDYSIEIIEQ